MKFISRSCTHATSLTIEWIYLRADEGVEEKYISIQPTSNLSGVVHCSGQILDNHLLDIESTLENRCFKTPTNIQFINIQQLDQGEGVRSDNWPPLHWGMIWQLDLTNLLQISYKLGSSPNLKTLIKKVGKHPISSSSFFIMTIDKG